MGTPKFGGKDDTICGQIWVPYHDSQSAPFWAEITGRRRMWKPGAVTDLNNSQSKTQISN